VGAKKTRLHRQPSPTETFGNVATRTLQTFIYMIDGFFHQGQLWLLSAPHRIQ
jgi:hypothetical protein